LREHTFVHSTNHKGAVAEAKVVAAAVDAGVPVLTPVAEHGHYDLAFDLGERIVRVQCKWGALDREKKVICTRIGRSRHTPRGYVLATYAHDDIDALAIYCGELDTCYLVPVDLVADKYALHLRVGAPQNHQRAALHYAADHLLPGAIAQLGERLTGSQKVGGSSPPGSTSSLSLSPSLDTAWLRNTVGMQEFHARIGHYVRHVQAGNTVLVTRWGRPVARLVPANDHIPPEGGENEAAQPC